VLALALTALFTSTIPAFALAANTVGNDRSFIDRPDEVSGFQLHFIYVVPADGKDQHFDTNGQIATWLNYSEAWLEKMIGHQLVIDKYQGAYDITFMKSHYSVEMLQNQMKPDKSASPTKVLDELAAEYLQTNLDPAPNKTYMFLFSEPLSKTSCGLGGINSDVALGFTGPGCWSGPTEDTNSLTGLGKMSKTILHEIFHTLGVAHLCINNSDIMIGSPECNIATDYGQVPLTLDLQHTNYSGGDASGVDILKMPVWTDGTGTDSYRDLTSLKSYSAQIIHPGNSIPYVIAGKTSAPFSWDFSKEVSPSPLASLKCLLTSGDKSLVGITSGQACTFDIPSNWRVGKNFTASAIFQNGPFRAQVQTQGIVVRNDLSSSECTGFACFVGGSTTLQSNCWSAGINQFDLQQSVEGKWLKVASIPTLPSTNCSSPDTNLVAKYKITFDEPGIYQYRFYFPGSAKLTPAIDGPSATIIVNSYDPEPSEKAISLAKTAPQLVAAQLKLDQNLEINAVKESAGKIAAMKIAREETVKANLAKAIADQAVLDGTSISKSEPSPSASPSASPSPSPTLISPPPAVSRLRTIICVKGKRIRKITAINSKCPSGYKLKV
jgi:hypothetical protein